MLAEDFIRIRKATWERLTELVERSQLRGLTSLSAEEITELGRLYRSTTSDLAVARRDFRQHNVARYLNDLVAQAHGVVYQGRSGQQGGVRHFFTHTFPQTFRATWRYTLASFLMFFLPALLAFGLTFLDPSYGSTLVPGAEQVINDIRDKREWWKEINTAGNAFSGARIMTNNIQVTFLAFAGGVLFGTLTLYVLVNNGLLIGVVAGASQALGFAGNLWGFVAAHGVVELSVIFIGGGAGLQLGWALVRPGLLTRRASLSLAARRAGYLLLGCAPLLVLAGLIEGYISPSDLPVSLKVGVALLSGGLLYSYLLLSGRETRKSRPES